MSLKQIRKELRETGSKKHAKTLQWFFKTGPGEYAEGDIFLGLKMHQTRKIATKYADLSLNETTQLLKSKIHEERLAALLILKERFAKADEVIKKKIYEIYLQNTKHINNWDLVDLSAEHIVGSFLMNKNKLPLYRLARSPLLWDRRISILSTFHYIKNQKFNDTLRIAKILISDKHDLIHKAVGWMLREVGKRNLAAEERFLKKLNRQMPRTMLRYAIERFPEPKRLTYLKGQA